MAIDEVSEALSDLKDRWKASCEDSSAHAQSLRSISGDNAASLPRLNALAQDSLSSLRSLQRKFEILSLQLISVEEKDECLKILEEWKREYQSLHSTLRAANLQAKANIQKAAKQERELLLGGGEESTKLRRNLQTQAGMSAAAESVTESLRRTRQMMIQEVERSAGTLATLDESTTTLRKADSEYKGQHTLLTTTRGLLSILKRQDIADRIIIAIGFIIFSLVVTYIFNQRIGIFRMRTSQVAYGGLKSHEASSSISVNQLPQIDTDVSSKIDTVLPSEHLPETEESETIKEISDANIYFDKFPSGYEIPPQLEAEIHEEL